MVMMMMPTQAIKFTGITVFTLNYSLSYKTVNNGAGQFLMMKERILSVLYSTTHLTSVSDSPHQLFIIKKILKILF